MIGSAGTDAKCDWLKQELGFDHVFNYKTCKDVGNFFAEVAHNGLDIFYDMVIC